MTSNTPLIEARNVEVHFEQHGSLSDRILLRNPDILRAVDNVSLELHENEVVGVIGESGCGKTTLLMAMLKLRKLAGGSVMFDGEDIATFGRKEEKAFRSDVQPVFQDPFNSLDPKMTVRESLIEPLKIHEMDNRDRRIRETLKRVELNPVDNYIDRLPKALSGGEKQRVSIARALIVEPEVLLADEPVSMLDVSTQASVLNLLSELTDDLGLSMLYISHDLSTVAHVCNTVNVMYLGRIVESAPTSRLINDPKHPYSQALIKAVPVPDPHYERSRTEIEQSPPDPIGIGEGCRFRDRCPERMDICERTPLFMNVDDDHHAACHLYYDHEEEVDGNINKPHEKAALGEEA